MLQKARAELNFLLEGLECYKYTQMKAYAITLYKLTTELKSSDGTEIEYSNLLVVFVGVLTETHRPSKINLQGFWGVGKLPFVK